MASHSSINKSFLLSFTSGNITYVISHYYTINSQHRNYDSLLSNPRPNSSSHEVSLTNLSGGNPRGSAPIRGPQQGAAPSSLLKVIRCNCTGKCGNGRCSCRKNGLLCTLACGHCKGTTCTNGEVLKQLLQTRTLVVNEIRHDVNGPMMK